MTFPNTSFTTYLPSALPAKLTRRERLSIELGRAIEEAAYPGELLNQLQAAVTLNQHALAESQALFSAAPTLYQVVHAQVSQALNCDPDKLTWTSALQPDAPVTLTLTQIAVESLRDDFITGDINQAVSLNDDSGASSKPVALSPAQILNQLDSLNLKDRFNLTVRDYWQGLAQGQSVSCCEHVAELRRVSIKTRALLAQASGQLSEEGLETWLQVVDAPTDQKRMDAGGEVSNLQVSEIAWANGQTHGNGGGVVFKGAFVIHGRDAEQNPRELLFVPGMGMELFEFTSRSRLWAQMVRWIDSGAQPGWLLWQLLPYHSRSTLYGSGARLPLEHLDYKAVAGDIFEHSARASVFTQHTNELICAVTLSPALQTGEAILLATDLSGVALSYAQTTEQWRREVAGKSLPADLTEVLAEIARGHARWHEDDISFGSLAPELALRIRQEKIELYEHSILQLLRPGQLAEDTAAFIAFVKYQTALQAERALSLTCLKDLLTVTQRDNADLLTSDAGQGSPQSRLIASRSQALLIEGQLQVLHKQLGAADFTLLTQALKLNIVGHDSATDLRVVAIAIGTAQQPFALVGSFAITSRQGLLTPSLAGPALLFVPGQDGGLVKFRSLAQLQEHLGQTLFRCSDCSLWSTVALEQQAAARAWIETVPESVRVALQLSEITLGIIEFSVKAQIKAHKKSMQAIKNNVLVIAGADRQAALGILGQTSALVLQVPEHAARKQAFDHILLMRQAQLLKQQLAPWLLLETNEVQVDYARRTRQINENLLAIERYLFKHLPSLDEFAAQKLREQFKHDGFDDELDPLADMLSLPDHVDIISTLPTANLPTFANIVPQIELAQVPQGVRTYNLVQFALENMDPDDPSIALRLKHLQVLKPEWKTRLSVGYLTRVMSALDISGAYEQQINQVFYGKPCLEENQVSEAPGSDLRIQLMVRPFRQTLELELWMARQQAMDPSALTLFSRAIGARKAADLKVGGMDIAVGNVTYSSVVERYGLTSVAGVRVIRDTLSDMTLIYLPGIPGGNSLVMYPSLELANAALAEMGSKPQWLAYLAQRTEPEEQAAHIQEHLADGAGYAPQDWIGATFAGEIDMGRGLSTARSDRIIQVLRLMSQSNAKRERLRNERNHQQRIAKLFTWLAFVPGLNMAADIYYIVQAFKALHTAHSAYEVAQQVLQIGMCMTDMLVTVASFGEDGVKASPWERVAPQDHEQTKWLMQPLKARQALSHEGWGARVINPEPKPMLAPDFSGYEVPLTAHEGCSLTGKYDLGSYRKDGVQFIVQKGQSYRVARPKNAQALHLQDPFTQRLGLPVRRSEAGEWFYAAGYGLPGGGKTAETILINCGMSLEIAQGLLADYDFPVNSGLDKLFAKNVQRDGIKPEWANKFRAVTAEPMAGSSRCLSACVPVTLGLEDYVVQPAVTPAMISGSELMHRVVIGENDLLVAAGTDGDGFNSLYRPNALEQGALEVCGRLSPEGIYHIQHPVERDYISIGGYFYETRFNQTLNRFTIIKTDGSTQDGLMVEPAGPFQFMGEWRLLSAQVLQKDLSARLDALVRQLMPLPATDQQVSSYISNYGHQILKYTVPELLLARGLVELDTLTRQYVYRHGLPVETLIRIVEAKINGLPIPDGLPIYDELQGLIPLSVLGGNSFNINAALVSGNYLHFMPLTAEESEMHTKVKTILSNPKSIVLSAAGAMTPFLSTVLNRKGYTFLGRETVLSRGLLGLVFTGPNGEVYVAATRLSAYRGPGGALKSIAVHNTQKGLHFGDSWVESELAKELFAHPDSKVAKIVRAAHERHRLYKLLVSVTRGGDVLICRLQLPGDL